MIIIGIVFVIRIFFEKNSSFLFKIFVNFFLKLFGFIIKIIKEFVLFDIDSLGLIEFVEVFLVVFVFLFDSFLVLFLLGFLNFVNIK